MGITIWYSLLADSKDKIDQITDKWEKEYGPEFAYYGIDHNFNRLDNDQCLFNVDTTPWDMKTLARNVKTPAELEKWMNKTGYVEVPKVPETAFDVAEMMDEPVNFIKFTKPYEDAPVDRWSATVIFPTKNYYTPEEGGKMAMMTTCNGFMDTPSNTETFDMGFAEITPDKFFAQSFTKTQPFDVAEFDKAARAHMIICDFLNDVKDSGLAKVSYSDEGQYCETRNPEMLMKNFKGNLDVIERVSGQLSEAGWQPIKKEELEAEQELQKIESEKEAWKKEEEVIEKETAERESRLKSKATLNGWM